MIGGVQNIGRITELRQRVLFTFAMLGMVLADNILFFFIIGVSELGTRQPCSKTVDYVGFSSLSFGNVAQSGLSEGFVLADLTVVGSLAGGGPLGDVDLIYVPEPSTLLLVALGVIGLLAHRRHAWCACP